MSMRKFWIGFVSFVVLLLVMLLCIVLFGRGDAASDGLSEEERYILDISTIDAWADDPYYALMPHSDYENLETLIRSGQPNLILRVKIEERGDCVVYDPLGFFNESYLGNWEYSAHHYIATPYHCTIADVYVGDMERFCPGDDFTFYAPYGSIGKYGIRYEGCPYFRTGHEYILFFTIWDVETIGLWFDLTHPSAVCEIMLQDERTFLTQTEDASRMFREAGADVETLINQIKAVYESDPYPLYMPTMQPATDQHSVVDKYLKPEP